MRINFMEIRIGFPNVGHDMVGIGAGDKDLGLVDTFQQAAAAVSIQLGHDIIQQENRTLADVLCDDAEFSQFERQDGRSLLSLGRIGLHGLLIQQQFKIITMRTDAGDALLNVIANISFIFSKDFVHNLWNAIIKGYSGYRLISNV